MIYTHQIDAAAELAAVEYVRAKNKPSAVTALREKMPDVSAGEAWLMIEAIDAYENIREET